MITKAEWVEIGKKTENKSIPEALTTTETK